MPHAAPPDRVGPQTGSCRVSGQPIASVAFRPPFGVGGGHRQTLLGHLLRRRVPWSLPAEDVIVESEPDVRLLLRASWQPGPRPRRRP